ncbi:hypothetical protein PoB_006873300 [Plakobranchus ocellatus]|uniref:Uncharacterized protein n=1 Tax=Plakobranchus ocellatus TaxID=259542 RepID=A0AAV4DD99_9GAST|nr:hypothetical protein PoB_006873300 [Plakobranchus ocellatus]
MKTVFLKSKINSPFLSFEFLPPLNLSKSLCPGHLRPADVCLCQSSTHNTVFKTWDVAPFVQSNSLFFGLALLRKLELDLFSFAEDPNNRRSDTRGA